MNINRSKAILQLKALINKVEKECDIIGEGASKNEYGVNYVEDLIQLNRHLIQEVRKLLTDRTPYRYKEYRDKQTERLIDKVTNDTIRESQGKLVDIIPHVQGRLEGMDILPNKSTFVKVRKRK